MGYQAEVISLSEALSLAVSITGDSPADVELQFLAALRDGAITACGDHDETRLVLTGEKRGLWDKRAWDRRRSTYHGCKVSQEQWRAASRAYEPTPRGGGSAATSSVDFDESRVSVNTDEATHTRIENITIPRAEVERAFSIVPATSKELIAANAVRPSPLLSLALSVHRCELLLAAGETEEAWELWRRIEPEVHERVVRPSRVTEAPAPSRADVNSPRGTRLKSMDAHAVKLRSSLRELRKTEFPQEVESALVIVRSGQSTAAPSPDRIAHALQGGPGAVSTPTSPPSAQSRGASFGDWIFAQVTELFPSQPAPDRLRDLVSLIEKRWPGKSGPAPSRSTIEKCVSPLWKRWKKGCTADDLRKAYEHWRSSERARQSTKRSK